MVESWAAERADTMADLLAAPKAVWLVEVTAVQRAASLEP